MASKVLKPRKSRRSQANRVSRRPPPTYTLGLRQNIRLWEDDDASLHRRGQKGPPLFFEIASASLVVQSSAGGTIAQAMDADPIAGFVLNGWATRYATLFREYRILKVFFRIKALAANTGETRVTIDDRNNTTPTLALMEDQGYVTVENAVGAKDTCFAEWVNNDISEAGFSLTSASMTPCYLKIYTDNASLNTPANNTTKFTVKATYHFCFKGRV